MYPCSQPADRLNRDCQCVGFDVQAARRLAGPGLLAEHAHLFSDLPVFLAANHESQIRALVAAVERTVALPMYRDAVLAHAPAIARGPRENRGVFLGFDFHVTPQGPRLIEINTNAGGAMLNAIAGEAQRSCCAEAGDSLRNSPRAVELQTRMVDMFRTEWRLARGDAPLRHIAIVDEQPESQFLYPEFVLFRQLFESHGIAASICDPRDLRVAGKALWLGDRRVDLVYNRSTDFALAGAGHGALAHAYESGLAVVTPHPHAHAIYSDKRNLVLLGDADFLGRCGARPADIHLLSTMIPVTREVSNDERWWCDRKRWFFKPAAGFGSRGSYRGDKLTRRVFAGIAAGGYVAQELTPPSERRRHGDGIVHPYKLDVRAYAYAGEVKQLAARLYQGQTTNFRTPGGGFAAVFVPKDTGDTLGANG